MRAVLALTACTLALFAGPALADQQDSPATELRPPGPPTTVLQPPGPPVTVLQPPGPPIAPNPGAAGFGDGSVMPGDGMIPPQPVGGANLPAVQLPGSAFSAPGGMPGMMGGMSGMGPAGFAR